LTGAVAWRFSDLPVLDRISTELSRMNPPLPGAGPHSRVRAVQGPAGALMVRPPRPRSVGGWSDRLP